MGCRCSDGEECRRLFRGRTSGSSASTMEGAAGSSKLTVEDQDSLKKDIYTDGRGAAGSSALTTYKLERHLTDGRRAIGSSASTTEGAARSSTLMTDE